MLSLQQTTIKVWWISARGKKKQTGGLKGGLKDACRVRSGAGEGEIVRWAAFLSAEVMAEW